MSLSTICDRPLSRVIVVDHDRRVQRQRPLPVVARRRRRPIAIDLAIFDILAAMLRAFLFVARVPVHARARSTRICGRWGA